MRKIIIVFLALAPELLAQERKVDPTWLYRDVSVLHERTVDLSGGACHYVPIFGEGDADSGVPQSIGRFGELTVDANAACPTVEYPHQEELYFVLGGNGVLHYGNESHALAPNDFTYLPPTVRHSLSNTGTQLLKLVVATVKIPLETPISQPPKLEVANLDELKEQTVGGHPSSVLYKLLIGPRHTKRDRISQAYALADFFLMDFAPGGTNFPHHHETAEEIYLVLDGKGQMAAGGGMDGVEGLHAAKARDAYYFRTNCTVGFYNQKGTDAKAHILAVRAYVPMPKDPD
jgi:mannose-6-phosphate isomerase-like protein (cupin superfamily)